MENVNFANVMRESFEGAAIVGLGAVLFFLSLTAIGAMAQWLTVNEFKEFKSLISLIEENNEKGKITNEGNAGQSQT